jgi:hemerythrin-like domain-containing protein
MASKFMHTRRDFILAGTAMGTIAGFPSIVMSAEKQVSQVQNDKTKADEVSPAEDLMREHGVLERILLIYSESAQRLHRKKELDIGALAGTAKIVRAFIEDYHSKLEEDHVFPRLEKAGKHIELVKVLREQHQAGRKLTDNILRLVVPPRILDENNVDNLTITLGSFIRMYHPHAAREDTVIFPALRSIMDSKEYDEMGGQFEDLEHKLFGESGFENIVERVAEIEKTLGIYELDQFTAKI